jgi:hypothetical protein
MRALEDEHLGLFHPNGTNFRYTDIAPGSVTPMVSPISLMRRLHAHVLFMKHRTPSLDYNILGEHSPSAGHQSLTCSSSSRGVDPHDGGRY